MAISDSNKKYYISLIKTSLDKIFKDYTYDPEYIESTTIYSIDHFIYYVELQSFSPCYFGDPVNMNHLTNNIDECFLNTLKKPLKNKGMDMIGDPKYTSEIKYSTKIYIYIYL